MEMYEDTANIEDWIEENPLANTLLKKSSIRKEELEAILLYFSSEDVSFNDLATELGINRSGAWKRWKKGYDKIIESFYTLELSVYAGILDPEAIEFLTEDLRDYLRLARGEGNIEDIRDRLEKRMAQLEKAGL